MTTTRLQNLAGKYLPPLTPVLWGTSALVVSRATFPLSSEASSTVVHCYVTYLQWVHSKSEIMTTAGFLCRDL